MGVPYCNYSIIYPQNPILIIKALYYHYYYDYDCYYYYYFYCYFNIEFQGRFRQGFDSRAAHNKHVGLGGLVYMGWVVVKIRVPFGSPL